MKPLTHIALLILTALAFTSCRDTQESLTEERIDLYLEAAETLEEISADKNVEHNIKKLESLYEKLEVNAQRFIALRKKQGMKKEENSLQETALIMEDDELMFSTDIEYQKAHHAYQMAFIKALMNGKYPRQ